MLGITKYHQHAKSRTTRLRLFQSLILIGCIVFFGYPYVVGVETAGEKQTEPGTIDPLETQERDFSKFTHSNQFHSQLPCLLCHRRDDNSTRIRFPGKVSHLPCAGCHALQFSDQSSPICTICHVNPQIGSMKRFPGLRNFGVKFNHSRHSRVNCVTCHKPTGRGVAKSIPSGSSAHGTCFQCHTASSSNSMSSCSTCHQPGRPVRTSEWAVAFRKGFSHAKHAGAKGQNCNTCHTVRAGSGRGRQVTAPLASMHFAPAERQSCASCHNGERAFGPNEFANCKRCHQSNNFKF